MESNPQLRRLTSRRQRPAHEDATIDLFVNGTLMRDQKLHENLTGADFIGEVRTARRYRLYSIGDVHPGMFPVEEHGIAVAGELYRVPAHILAAVEVGEPPDLYRGRVELEDGRIVDGILYPRELAEARHRDISAFGDWRAYQAALETQEFETKSDRLSSGKRLKT
jgi:gamma-glutamylcyclotransferase (GGCT)/AIG2-like uncharacterized protein YtfP